MSKLIPAETGGSIEQPTEHEKLKMIGLTRSSSQEVAEGYGPSIQKSEHITSCPFCTLYKICKDRSVW